MMKVIRKMMLTLSIATVIWGAGAEPVSARTVTQAVNNWVALRAQMGSAIAGTVSSVRQCTAPNGVTFYVARLSAGGFVVTSTDTTLDPVVLFSDSEDLVEDTRNPLWTLLVKDMALRQKAASSGNSSQAGAAKTSAGRAATRWTRLLTANDTAAAGAPAASPYDYQGRSGQKSVSDVRVAPLLKTKWGQSSAGGGYCFNYYTPRHYLCGCTATAGAQILRYHKFPTDEIEPEWYECQVDGWYDYLEQIGGTYDWDMMPEVPGRGMTESQRQAIGKLTYNVGLAVCSSYSRNWTGGHLDLFIDLCKSWGYAHGTTFHRYDDCQEEGFTDRDMKSVLIPNLDAKLPVGVRIYDFFREDETSHFVVADGYGYSDGQFSVHLNFGWDGNSDAWYVLPEIIASGTRYTTINYLYGNIYPHGPEEGAIASGRVSEATSSEDMPVSGIVVTATGSDGTTLRTTTDENGIYAFLLEEDEWVIAPEGMAAMSYSVSIYDVEDVDDVTFDCWPDEEDYFDPTDRTWSGNYYDLNFQIKVCTVNFEANGGSDVKSMTRSEGAPLGALPSSSRTGYTFAGWFTAAQGGTEVSPLMPVTDDATFFAHWTPNAYVVQFDAKGGEGTMTQMDFVYDVPKTLRPNAFLKGDAAFLGWALSPRGPVAFADCALVKNLATTGVVTLYAVWKGEAIVIEAGRVCQLDLVRDFGIEIPADVDYAAGDKVTIKVKGLAKGLKLVATPVYADPNAKKKVIVDYAYTIEGVPTETVDFDTQTMYARVTVTYKDKTKGEKGKAETLQLVPLSIVPAEVRTLEAGVLNEVYEPADIAALWPEVADAKVNPKEWSFKGWPAGIKYNATAKDASWSYKGPDGKSEKAIAVPYTVYGQPTKAGEYPITATWKHKLADGKTTVSETFSAVLTVWGDDGASDFRYVDQAYVATATKALDATWKNFSGLPTGIKYTTRLIAADAKKGTPEYPACSLYGTPTKAGVFAVTATKVDPDDPAGRKTVKEMFLWKVSPATAPTLALDTGTAPVEDLKAQIVQGANQSFSIATSDIAAKVTVTGLPTGLKLVATPVKEGSKTVGNTYSVQGVASKPGEYFITFKTVLNGVTTVTTTAFTVQANPFAATYRGYACARPAAGAAERLGVAEVTVAAAGTVKLTYTEGKTKYTANVKSFDWDDATGKGTAEGLVLKVSSADRQLGYGDRKASLTFEDRGAYLYAKLDIADANGFTLLKSSGSLYAAVKTTEVPLPASQTFVFRTKDGPNTNALATVSVAYDAKKATAAFSGKLYDGTAVKATVPVLRWDDEGTTDDYVFAPFLVVAKDGTVYCFDGFSSDSDGGYIDWVREDGEDTDYSHSTPADYTDADAKFAELVPATGAFTFNWGSDAEVVGAPTESFAFEVTTDTKGVAVYDADVVEGEKPLATVTAKVGKLTGAISVSFTSKKGDKAKYAVELVWRGEELFAGHVTRTWKGPDEKTGKPVNKTAFGRAEVK